MKKIFQLQVENKTPERQLEAIKNEIRKYMKRERKKKLPEESLYWDFECRFGSSADDAKGVTSSELISSLDQAAASEWKSCYVEILAKAVAKSTETPETEEDTAS